MAAIGTIPVLFATGIHASRPAASAVGKGGLYSCTTHSLVYQTDGSSWTTWATLGSVGSGTLTTIEEVDGSPTDSAVTKLVLPNGTLSIVSHVATYTPSAGFTPAFYRYKRTSGAYTTTSSSFADIDATNLAASLATGARRVRCVLSATCSIGVASEALAFELLVDTVAQGGGTGGLFYTAEAVVHKHVHLEFLTDVLTAASHTFKWQWRTSSGATGTLQAGTTAPAAPLIAYFEETDIIS